MQLAQDDLRNLFPENPLMRINSQVRYRNLRMQQALAEGDAVKISNLCGSSKGSKMASEGSSSMQSVLQASSQRVKAMVLVLYTTLSRFQKVDADNSAG